MLRLPQAQVAENLEKQAQVMAVIEREAAAYKQAFGYAEWRGACEVRMLRWRTLPHENPPAVGQTL